MLHSLPYVYVHVYFQSAYIVCCLVCVTPVGRLEACFAFVLYHFFSVQHQGKGFVISAGITKAGVWIFLYLWMQKEEFLLKSACEFFPNTTSFLFCGNYFFSPGTLTPPCVLLRTGFFIHYWLGALIYIWNVYKLKTSKQNAVSDSVL